MRVRAMMVASPDMNLFMVNYLPLTFSGDFSREIIRFHDYNLQRSLHFGTHFGDLDLIQGHSNKKKYKKVKLQLCWCLLVLLLRLMDTFPPVS